MWLGPRGDGEWRRMGGRRAEINFFNGVTQWLAVNENNVFSRTRVFTVHTGVRGKCLVLRPVIEVRTNFRKLLVNFNLPRALWFVNVAQPVPAGARFNTRNSHVLRNPKCETRSSNLSSLSNNFVL